MQLEGSSSVSEISSASMPVTAAAAAPAAEEVSAAATNEGVKNGEVIGMEANSGDVVEEGDKMSSYGGNRWPRQETLALLKIRSDMDSVFRDSTLKAPLWEQVSRKLAELGYHRNPKKCKEKFENVYKYHKRTKEIENTNKSKGKSYKFFDQLQALENNKNQLFTPSIISQPLLPPITTTTATNTLTFPNPPPPTKNNNNNMMNHLFSSSSPSPTSTASDEVLVEDRSRTKKRKYWKDYFRSLTRQVLSNQEDMHKKFLEAIHRRESERIVQQDSWRAQEIARINKEHEILLQERTTAAAKDAAVIALLHKLSDQEIPSQPPPPQPPPQPLINGGHNVIPSTTDQNQSMKSPFSSSYSSRWPKAEIQALIRLRTSLDSKYQEKAPLWEDISAGMQRLGYNRSSKRCKEKWENINKYFKKVKESNKRRREDSKTCPYFDELEALYREKGRNQNISGTFQNDEPLMVQPEQQWMPPPQPPEGNAAEQQQQEAEEELEEDEEEFDGDSVEDDEEEGGNRYEIVTNKLSSVDHTQLNETR